MQQHNDVVEVALQELEDIRFRLERILRKMEEKKDGGDELTTTHIC